MWLNLVNWTSAPCELLHVPHPRHVSLISSNAGNSKIKVFLHVVSRHLHQPSVEYLADVAAGHEIAGFALGVEHGGFQGAWRVFPTQLQKSCSATPHTSNCPSLRFRCSNTCGQCRWAANPRPWTPGSPAVADGSWRWGPPGAGSRPAAGRKARPSAGCSPSPAALRCDAAAPPGSPPAGVEGEGTPQTHTRSVRCIMLIRKNYILNKYPCKHSNIMYNQEPSKKNNNRIYV